VHRGIVNYEILANAKAATLIVREEVVRVLKVEPLIDKVPHRYVLRWFDPGQTFCVFPAGFKYSTVL